MLVKHLNTCQSALDGALSILHLNVAVSHIESLRKLDKAIIDGTTNLQQALQDMKTSTDQQLHLALEQLAQQHKLILDEQTRVKAKELVETLRYPELESRGRHIDNESPNTDYAWLFTSESWGIPQVLDLVRFLHSGAGLFWISGEAASGKSSLMYYLAHPWHDGRELWRWDGAQEVAFACHFCWVAGTEMQKSQRALLQSLLYYILHADLDIVPAVFRARWNTGASKISWSVNELLTCLEAAVNETRKRLCIFIDGLDELQPERDHQQLVANLKRLSSYSHVKMIVSSRPWSNFDCLESEGKVLRMENINRKGIVDYLERRLSSLTALSNVSWPRVLELDDTWYLHAQDSAQDFVHNLVSKAKGNFLWATLVADTIHTRLGNNINSLSTLEQFVDRLPNNLEEYFRTMILERSNPDLRSEMAMALWIALLPLPTTPWVSFWMLSQSGKSDVPSLMEPNIALMTDFCDFSLSEFEKMAHETNQFLNQCCRDMLHVNWEFGDNYGGSPSARKWLLSEVVFRHRMIFDYCKTQEVQTMLIRYTPPTFHDRLFTERLAILQAKLGLDQDYAFRFEWHCWYLREIIDSLLDTASGRNKHDVAVLELVEEMQRVVTHDLQRCTPISSDDNDMEMNRLCSGFHAFGLYSFTEAVLDRARKWSPFDITKTFDEVLTYSDITSTRLVRKFLLAGADPNDRRTFFPGRKAIWTTSWCMFLQRLIKNEEHAPYIYTFTNWARERVVKKFEPSQETFSSPHIWTTIKDLLEFGAELEITNDLICSEDDTDWCADPLATLRSRLPMDEGSEWPELLESYLQPEKRKEIQERRRKIDEDRS